MGKGDKRSRRGKIFAGSYGKTRPKKKKVTVQPVEEKPVKKRAGKARPAA
ncbi:MAG: 30S ribosomal protein THX [Pyrinomonadaceae bacterium]